MLHIQPTWIFDVSNLDMIDLSYCNKSDFMSSCFSFENLNMRTDAEYVSERYMGHHPELNGVCNLGV